VGLERVNMLNKEPHLIHIDIDDIRNFFKPVGYSGQNAENFQKPSGRGVHILFNEAVRRGFSIILDSNFADFDMARQNIQRLIKRGYFVSMNYIYNEPQKCLEYAQMRESVTKRKVPIDIIQESLKNSFETTFAIKALFGDGVILNLLHRIKNAEYSDISSTEFFDILADDTGGHNATR
jgi:UDP-N-acetylglucosamine kinase